MSRLADHPDWAYLLREVDGIYRRGSAGGSAPIRAHQRQVRERLNRVVQGNPPVAEAAPADQPVVAHLGRALDRAVDGPLAALARAVGRIAPRLDWRLGYRRPPPALARRFAYTEVLGPNGPVIAEPLTLGMVLLAPGTTYPQHHHRDIEESYISLTGAWSENDAAVHAPGSLILNKVGETHRLTVGDHEPCLLAYAWIGPPERLAAPEMRLGRGG
ncbi:dimethylsulfonioproprionate lyase family protein [Roseospirillum parvum]|uniref:Dimethylpropiothetin dethiomethylase n=1 Tax=Roseospirillum parvum TaxID=83401 RepID=A0A1G8BCN2_9PROT|nr:dimethylsulfonioproprionate lyase family protein [Roseospirillum parvum]SDH30997.1 dimethylpropiothetin dethiomethylase [Roseospirillum parvum]